MILIQGGAPKVRARSRKRRAEQGEPAEQSADLTVVNEVAAGVAHDLNNRLSVILGQAQLLRRGAGLDPLVDRKLEKIEQEVLRASTMTRGLLERARREPRHEPLSVNALVPRALDLVHAKLRAHATDVQMEFSSEPAVIVGDADQMTQVLVHLIDNAIDAMGESGTLTITTEVTDDAVRLSVTDTGPGMETEHASRIFEPFYTTKTHGQGDGVGLFLTLGILKGHGGSIAVETAPGRGTTMRIRLPRALDAAPWLVVVK